MMKFNFVQTTKIIGVLILCSLVFACTKNKPIIGTYLASFSGTYLDEEGKVVPVNRVYVLEFDKVTNTEISIDGGQSVLQKHKNHKVSGIISKSTIYGGSDVGYVHTSLEIDGKWEKKSFKNYHITGSFTSTYKIIDNAAEKTTTYDVAGVFVIESD